MKILLRTRLYICLFVLLILHHVSWSQNIDFGKSYVNITKGTNGGTIEPGDTLEIRASFVVRSGVYDSCGYFDAVPAGTTFIPGSIAVITNEGKVYKGFSDTQFNDEGWISGSNIRINLGYVQTDAPARYFRRGRIRNSWVGAANTTPLHKPSFYKSTCIQIASFRVRVTAPLGSIINIGGGSMTYKNGAAALTTFTFPSNLVGIYTNIGMCPNTIGANALGAEFNGTFGSGKPRNRGTSAFVPVGYTFDFFNQNGPNDYYYGIANNTSTRTNYTTLNTWPKPDGSSPSHRVFGVWDIIGDHTGAVSPTAGNPAADTINNSNAGYMLVVNAAYRIDSAFQHSITGLCPNTYYEISCWIRNICSKCGCDSNGNGATGGASYIPTVVAPPGTADSSGVYPNITFEVDGIDYYTTGNIKYTGQWVKKGFTFKTGATGNMVLKFFNNASGGGGNDWALDDISVSTCFPNLLMTPSNYTGCVNNPVNFSATVLSYFNNYTEYMWQKSNDGGLTWTNDGAAGSATVSGSPGAYSYTVNHPAFIATATDNGSKYRLVVATTNANLASSCAISGTTSFVNLTINNCVILTANLKSWDGKVENGLAVLNWSTESETGPITYEVERSVDGINFSYVGSVLGTYSSGQTNGNYTLTDAQAVKGNIYYRLKIKSTGEQDRYSQVIMLSADNIVQFAVKMLANPFSNQIGMNLYIPAKDKVKFRLLDTYGRVLLNKEVLFDKGMNYHTISNLQGLSKGVYVMNVMYGREQVNIKLIKE